MAGVLGNYFAGTAIAYLEQTTKFLSPVRPGETITTEWKVIKKEPKAKYNGGVITSEAKCKNQHRKTVAEGKGKIVDLEGQGNKMMAFMPLIFAFIFYQMPSGLVLYWLCNNVLAIGHQYLIRRQDKSKVDDQQDEGNKGKKNRSNRE